MDFTKIEPIEYNGQRVATTTYLARFVAQNTGEAYNKVRMHIRDLAYRKLDKATFFSLQGHEHKNFCVKNPQVYSKSYGILLFTAKAIYELARYPRLKVLKVFAEKYFGTPIESPAITPIESTADVTALTPVEWSSQRVLTTEQLAEFYETDIKRISENFSRNQDKFTENKHYFKIDGQALQNLRSANSGLQISPMTRTLYLWTERGAARHAKMLTTEKAWQVFEFLEENYFSGAKIVEVQPTAKPAIKPAEIVNEIGATRDAIVKVFAVKDGIALAQSIVMVGEYFNRDLTAFNQFLPAADHNVGYMNSTQLGAKVGKSARQINAESVRKGIQRKEGDFYLLTEYDKKFGEMIPYQNPDNKHTGYRTLWNDNAVNEFNDFYYD